MMNSQPRLIDNRWFIIALLFGATGVLGIPVLFMSRAFSAPAKWGLAIAATLYTLLLVWIVWLILVWSYGRIADALGW